MMAKTTSNDKPDTNIAVLELYITALSAYHRIVSKVKKNNETAKHSNDTKKINLCYYSLM